MKSSLFFLFIFLSSYIDIGISPSDVYICNSKGGKKYHYQKNCRGLNACKASVKALSLSDAKKQGKTLCGWED